MMNRFEFESSILDRKIKNVAADLVKQGYSPWVAYARAAQIVREDRSRNAKGQQVREGE